MLLLRAGDTILRAYVTYPLGVNINLVNIILQT